MTAPIDLLLAGSEVGALLVDAVERRDAVDAFLLSCAATQLAEDWLEGEATTIQRAAAHLSSGPRFPAAIARLGARASVWTRRNRPAGGRAAEVAVRAGALSASLAPLVLDGAETTAIADPWRVAADAADAIAAGLRRLPLGAELIRLPSCFRSFDQRPADVATLVDDYLTAARQQPPPQHRPPQHQLSVLVVGLRTSGSYLAPLAATALRGAGLSDVTTLTLRPGLPPRPVERRKLRTAAASATRVVVVDDPPTTGSSIRRTVDDLVTAGIPVEAIAVLVAVTDVVPEVLATCGATVIALPWARWAVHQQLDTPAVTKTLGRLVGGRLGPVLEVVPEEGLPEPQRGHVRRRFTVTLGGTDEARRTVAVEGVGLGFLGRHAQAVAERLGPLVPQVFGFEDGLLFRQWLPDSERLDLLDPETVPATASAVARHVAERAEALAVDEDRSAFLSGRQAVWEVAAEAMSGALGRFSVPLRPLVVHPVIRRALAVDRPAVLDGWASPGAWFEGDGAARKVSFAEGAFSHLDLWCTDPLYDLASVAADLDDETAGDALRRAAGDALGWVAPERWMAYQLVRIWDRRRRGLMSGADAARARSRAAQRFFAAAYLDDLAGTARTATGPFCAIDIDGVLECTPVGFASPTRASALALRALIAHEHRPLLVSGRSASEVAERIAAYGLAGGVAEYGAVVLDAAGNAVTELAGDDERDALARLRRLAAHSDLVVDEHYRRIVRLWRRDERGRRRAPEPEALRLLLGELGSAPVQVVPGEEQVDIVPARVTKQRGLEALLSHLGARSGTAVDFAVGDGPADLGMLRCARRAFAPANAARELRIEGITVANDAYQAGFFEAVGEYLGHRPGRCERCRPPALTPSTAGVARLLSLQEAGPGPALWRCATLVGRIQARRLIGR